MNAISTHPGQLLRIGDDERPSVTTHYSALQIVVPPKDDESFDRMAIVQNSGVLDFWNDPEEDVYPADDDSEL